MKPTISYWQTGWHIQDTLLSDSKHAFQTIQTAAGSSTGQFSSIPNNNVHIHIVMVHANLGCFVSTTRFADGQHANGKHNKQQINNSDINSNACLGVWEACDLTYFWNY